VNNTKLFKTTTAHDEARHESSQAKSRSSPNELPTRRPVSIQNVSTKVTPTRFSSSSQAQLASANLRLDGTPLHLLLAVPLALLLQELALLVGAQTTELRVTLLLLQLVCGDFALFGLLVLVDFADLGDLLVARLLDAAECFGTEVRSGGEVVGEADEVVEEREGGGVVGLKLEREVDALLGLGVVEAEMR
jgi:hypothetical protein